MLARATASILNVEEASSARDSTTLPDTKTTSTSRTLRRQKRLGRMTTTLTYFDKSPEALARSALPSSAYRADGSGVKPTNQEATDVAEVASALLRCSKRRGTCESVSGSIEESPLPFNPMESGLVSIKYERRAFDKEAIRASRQSPHFPTLALRLGKNTSASLCTRTAPSPPKAPARAASRLDETATACAFCPRIADGFVRDRHSTANEDARDGRSASAKTAFDDGCPALSPRAQAILLPATFTTGQSFIGAAPQRSTAFVHCYEHQQPVYTSTAHPT
ncbi:hypothetical protein EV714DRAFT_278139 [Schizophyllum commune]